MSMSVELPRDQLFGLVLCHLDTARVILRQEIIIEKMAPSDLHVDQPVGAFSWLRFMWRV